MDGIRDLGGKEGFGAIPVGSDDDPFQHDWEARMWAIARSGARGPGITIDWFRHGLECMVPSDYLSYRYFQKWCANYVMLLIDNGTFTSEEVKGGRTDRRADPAPALTVADVLQANRASQVSFEVEVETGPRFGVGDGVVTQRHMTSGHTRLPMYARGVRGRSSRITAPTFCPTRVPRARTRASTSTRFDSWARYYGALAPTRATASPSIFGKATLFRPEDPLAPREPVFEEPWHAQSLALADSLVRAGAFTATEWAEALGAALKAADARGLPDTTENSVRRRR